MKDQLLLRPLSEMQGKLFEMSGLAGFDSVTFIKVFMNSKMAEALDSDFDFLQWAGKEYIFDLLMEEFGNELVTGGRSFDREILYWTGYVYRFWNCCTGESSRCIHRVADGKTMAKVYWGYHTLDVEDAISRLKEAKNRRQ